MSWRQEAFELFGPRLDDPLDDPARREKVTQFHHEESITQAQREHEAQLTKEHFAQVINPRRDEEAAKLGLTPEELAQEVQDPETFKAICAIAREEGISFPEAKQKRALRWADQLSGLPDAVELAHRAINPLYGIDSLPKHKRRYARRLYEPPWRRTRPTKTSIRKRAACKRAVAKSADQRAVTSNIR
jgi:hypothetical protein